MCFVFFRHVLQLLTAADSLHSARLWFWWSESEPATAAAVLYRMQRRWMDVNHVRYRTKPHLSPQGYLCYSVNCFFFLQLCLVVNFFSYFFSTVSSFLFGIYYFFFFFSTAFNRVLWQYCRCCSIWPGGKPFSPRGLIMCKLSIYLSF